MKRRELEKRLIDLGWSFIRRGGRHDIWRKGEIEIAVPRHREIKEPTARSILRLAEVENS
jgi:mRNA interferase HicA